MALILRKSKTGLSQGEIIAEEHNSKEMQPLQICGRVQNQKGSMQLCHYIVAASEGYDMIYNIVCFKLVSITYLVTSYHNTI